MIQTRSTNPALRLNKTRRPRGGTSLRERVAGSLMGTGLVRTDFMGLGPLR